MKGNGWTLVDGQFWIDVRRMLTTMVDNAVVGDCDGRRLQWTVTWWLGMWQLTTWQSVMRWTATWCYNSWHYNLRCCRLPKSFIAMACRRIFIYLFIFFAWCCTWPCNLFRLVLHLLFHSPPLSTFALQISLFVVELMFLCVAMASTIACASTAFVG